MKKFLTSEKCIPLYISSKTLKVYFDVFLSVYQGLAD